MALESQVLVPALLSISSLLVCNMGLVLPTTPALTTHGKDHMGT